MDNKFTRYNDKLDDPSERCCGTTASSQCPYKKYPGSDYCVMHGANSTIATEKAETIRNYRLNRWKNRVDAFADNDQIKSLREEIGILRMILEEMLNKCTDTTELLLYSHRISDVAMKIEKLVISCDRLENRMGLLLSKRAVLQLASTYVNIINTYITDSDIIEKISDEMFAATQNVENPVPSQQTLLVE